MKKICIVLIFITICTVLSACGDEEPIQSSPPIEVQLVPYTSKSLGISSVIPEKWAQLSTGLFVREMPQSDPTFLLFGVITGLSADELMDPIIEQNGLLNVPLNKDYRETEALDWLLYSFEIQQGFLLSYYPDYGTQVLDFALAEVDGKIIAVSTGTPAKERDRLYEQVFIPAVDALRFYEVETGGTEEIVLPERDYW